jgi:hypothetical protein
MMHMSQEMMMMALEMVCYFFTAIGVALTFFISQRA